MLIAHISDLHIRPHGEKLYDFVDTNALISRHVATLNSIAKTTDSPDAVLITGDIVNCGQKQEYAMARRILGQLTMPLYIIPGNHDNNANLLEALTDICPPLENVGKTGEHTIRYTIEEFPVRFIMLDSSIGGELHGEIGREQMAWLEKELQKGTGRETAVCMHHHPLPSGNAHMDAIKCHDGEALIEMLSRYPNVTRLICGHTHRSIFQNVGRILICTVPGAAHQVPFHSTDLDGSYTLEPPALYFHRHTPETGLVTYSQSLAPFDGPYPFDSACACPEGQL
ncbi:MAG: phosphodiesterase [Pseudodesulfovibrio sp.]|uniref:Metallophosphoesterase n=1 Tax=Pseudodesulfovibrio aespoeensis (strain ATCC 700646 / DSM 10631 / Aspo-2) TaxID=643562 RepID=E6VYZ4_PSEA9|nr:MULTISPECIES: phosphodiesterase [Pseudodesulfovibrio]MBU4378448.1 phosphodiesterase [Pseudomonadota bacterium]ADU61657.1 metallophosphoesterase [Pseudodesulfovibrio aespoeensis Aspo-2]MBU4474081.1 phosphodiesterase [Pseudomonadota bacterium]MBU4517752.1 phosphodiesterase [Pseudomonadota bacterium]MBU4522184.1 phosphodiesterase [Pseudomonadota bacterium]